MNFLIRYGAFAAAVTLLGGIRVVTHADDSAASVAVGGIQLRREADISMEKEILTISEAKVTVEYEFLNETDKDITTVVAFPIPRYDIGFNDAGGTRDFNDFRLWVEGREVKYNTEARAKLRGKDYTDLLKGLGIDIASFGGWDEDRNGTPIGPITRLPDQELQRLSSIGLINSDRGASDDKLPLWDVLKSYYWTQTFPAHKILHVRHEYTPSMGFQEINPDALDPEVRKKRLAEDREKAQSPGALAADENYYNTISNSCVEPSLRKGLMKQALKKYGQDTGSIEMAWVDFILTTANSWKTPIKDFTLIIDRQSASRYAIPPQYVSLCWDGPIEKTAEGHFVAHKTNFVPEKELHVAFFSIISAP